MANFHILEADVKDHKARVIFHIAVPNENNIANINLQTAMSEYKQSPGSKVIGLPQVEIDQINVGQIYEHDEWVEYDGNLTNAQKLAIISARFATLSTTIIDRMRQTLKYWGYN